MNLLQIGPDGNRHAWDAKHLGAVSAKPHYLWRGRMQRLLWIGSPFFSDALSSCGWDAVARHNFEHAAVFGWHDLVRIAGFEPDVLVVADKSRAPYVLGVENFPCLTVFYSVDSHIHSWQPYYAQAFDACLVSLRGHGGRFAGAYLPAERVWWSPAFAWADDWPESGIARDTDCVFVGTVNANLPLRAAFLERVGAQLPGLRVVTGPYRQLYARARVVLNHCEHGDLNFRVFEAMGCGSCLVTPRIGHGLTDLFREGEHLRCYAADSSDSGLCASVDAAADEAVAQVRHLLEHPDEADRMRRAALECIDNAHRAVHRAEAFSSRVRALLASDPHIVARRRSNAADVRRQCLRLPYLHWAEELRSTGLGEAYLAAARGEFGLPWQQ